MRRIKELLAIALIGDGMVGLAQPRRHTRLWDIGPAGYRDAMQPFVRHPALTRAVSAAEIVGGLLLAARQRRGVRG